MIHNINHNNRELSKNNNKLRHQIDEFLYLLETKTFNTRNNIKKFNDLYASFKIDNTIPKNLFKKITKVYNLIDSIKNNSQKGGSTLTLQKLACGGGGCVYFIKQNGVTINGILLKLFHEQVPNQKIMIDNIDMALKFIENQENGRYFIEHGSTFKKFNIDSSSLQNIESYTIYEPYGYFVKKCDGDLEKLDFTMIPIKSTIDNISQTLLFMNKLGVIHGDIKFPNIMQSRIDDDIKSYIHDFDDLFFINIPNIRPRQNFTILPPTFSPMYVSPIYLLYRNSLKKNKAEDFDNNLVSSYMLTGIMGGIIPPQIKNCYDNIVKIRNDVCGFIIQLELYNFKNIQKLNGVDAYHKYLNLLQNTPAFENKKNDLVKFSDIYSLGTSCILKSFVLADQYKNKHIDTKLLQTTKQKLYDIGINYLYNYFTFKQNLRGGSTEILTRYHPSIYTNTKYTDKYINSQHLKIPILEKLYSQITTGRNFNMDQQDYDLANNFKITMDILDINEFFKAVQNQDIKKATSNIDIIQYHSSDNLQDTIELQRSELQRSNKI